MLLLLVLGMLEVLVVLVVLVVLKELVVFVGGIFGTVKTPNFFCGKNYRIHKEKFWRNFFFLSLRQSQKSTLTLESIIALFPSSCPGEGDNRGGWWGGHVGGGSWFFGQEAPRQCNQTDDTSRSITTGRNQSDSEKCFPYGICI